MPQMRIGAAEQLGPRFAEIGRAIAHRGQHVRESALAARDSTWDAFGFFRLPDAESEMLGFRVPGPESRVPLECSLLHKNSA